MPSMPHDGCVVTVYVIELPLVAVSGDAEAVISHRQPSLTSHVESMRIGSRANEPENSACFILKFHYEHNKDRFDLLTDANVGRSNLSTSTYK